MALTVTSTKMRFQDGRRYRPGDAFTLPEGVKPSREMTIVGETEVIPEAKPKKAKAATLAGMADENKGKAQGDDPDSFT